MRVVSFLLLYMCTGLIYCDQEGEEDANRKRIIEKLTRTRTVLLDNYHLVTRQIATDVYMFRSYRTVSVVFYPITRDVTEARFTFQSEDLHLNNIGSCTPQEVIINIKHGAYPAVNPDGYEFPKDFIDPNVREPIYTLDLLSDGRNVTYSIENPKPGNWYALIYIKWEDPRTQKVEQQGLVADCQTILYTDLQVKQESHIQKIDCPSDITIDYGALPVLFKCISNDSVDPVKLRVTVVSTPPEYKEVFFRVQALSIPSEDSNLIYCAFDPTQNDTEITFVPHPMAWHYVQIDHIVGNVSRIADCESYTRTSTDTINNTTIVDLMRDVQGRFFTFDYGLPTEDLQDPSSLFNISSSETKSLRFKVNQFLDIGGSLSIAVSLLMKMKYYMGYKREKNGSLLEFTEDNQFFKVVVCMDIGHTSVPLETGQCRYNDKVKPAAFVLNSTDSDTIYDKIYIPFPESGEYYLTFKVFCDEVVCPCRTAKNGSSYFVDTSGKARDTEVISLDGESTRVGSSECNATIVLSISSTSCVSGKCSNHGNCQLNTFGGLVMSFCSCYAGYGGWDCSDNTRMDSRFHMLASVLMLTLSNLFFILSVYVAIIRMYYTEAMMYAFTMVFSTFYHACDAPVQVAYCIIRGKILQFGDFYCGIMSFWVTLLAMSIINQKFSSFVQLTGAIVIALLTTWNMYSFISFLIPVLVGVSILLVSWFVDYRKSRRMRYPSSYYRWYLPLGVSLVSVGLSCYAALQTEENYKYVHSVWHMFVAVSVVFLLPDVRRGRNVNAFVPSKNYCKHVFANVFRRSQPQVAVD